MFSPNPDENHSPTILLSNTPDVGDGDDNIDNNGEDNVDYDNKTTRRDDDDSRTIDEDDNSDEDATTTTSSVDYDSADVDFEDSLINNSSASNTSTIQNTGHNPSNNHEDTTSASNEDTGKGNNADDLSHGAVKARDQQSSSSPEMLPLIAGVASAVLVAAIAIAALAYIWSRNQRRKQEKEEEDQMNIITEYVETNLSL